MGTTWAVTLVFTSIFNPKRITRTPLSCLNFTNYILHPNHKLFQKLSSNRHLHSIKTRTERLRRSLFPQAMRLLTIKHHTGHSCIHFALCVLLNTILYYWFTHCRFYIHLYILKNISWVYCNFGHWSWRNADFTGAAGSSWQWFCFDLFNLINYTN